VTLAILETSQISQNL